jgi:transposase
MADTPAPNSPALPDLIRRYLNGESTAQLAKDSHVARATIYNWIHRQDADPNLVNQVLITRFAECEEQLETASDQLELARARELNNNAKWQLERRSRMFAAKQEVQQDTTIRVVIEPAKPVQLRTQISQVVDVQPADIMDADGSD